jgi:hypothetical protein
VVGIKVQPPACIWHLWLGGSATRQPRELGDGCLSMTWARGAASSHRTGQRYAGSGEDTRSAGADDQPISAFWDYFSFDVVTPGSSAFIR